MTQYVALRMIGARVHSMTKRKVKRKNPAAVALGKRGGAQRWRGIPAEERSRIMAETIKVRWAKKEGRR